MRVPEEFEYSSDSNSEWMSAEDLEKWIEANADNIGKI